MIGPVLRQSVLVPSPYAYWEASWLVPADWDSGGNALGGSVHDSPAARLRGATPKSKINVKN
jgi:hypothetical protein